MSEANESTGVIHTSEEYMDNGKLEENSDCKENKLQNGMSLNQELEGKMPKVLNGNVTKKENKNPLIMGKTLSGNGSTADVTLRCRNGKQILEESKRLNLSQYQKQGAIPKGIYNKTKYEIRRETGVAKRNSQSPVPSGSRSRKPSNEKSVTNPRNSSEHLTSDNSSSKKDTGNKKLKMDEEFLQPFYYIIPEEPSPDFVLPSGSYYVTPKPLDLSILKNIICHPPKSETNKFKTELRDSGKSYTDVAYVDVDRGNLNDLSRDAPNLSHVTFARDLIFEYNSGCGENKISLTTIETLRSGLEAQIENFKSALTEVKTTLDQLNAMKLSLNSVNSEVTREKDFVKMVDIGDDLKETESESNGDFAEVCESIWVTNADGEEESDVKDENLTGNDGLETSEGEAVKEGSLSSEHSFNNEPDTSNLGGLDREHGPENQDTKDTDKNQVTDSLPEASPNSRKITANEHLVGENDEDNLIELESFDIQYKKMQFHLPNHDALELLKQCHEFKGNETLVEEYITKCLQEDKTNRIILDITFMLPDIDYDYLRTSLQNLGNDENAINVFINDLLENQNYPKAQLDQGEKEEKDRLWREYATNLNIKNFLFELPEANLKDAAASKSSEDINLVLSFLRTRYPTVETTFLKETYTNLKNVEAVCDHFDSIVKPVRLSESMFRRENFNKEFLLKVSFIDHKQEIEDYLSEIEEKKELERAEARLHNTFLKCSTCFDEEVIPSEVVTCPEGHVFCSGCVERYVKVEMGKAVYEFKCLSEGCNTSFSHSTLQQLLPISLYSNISRKQQAEEVKKADVDGLELCSFCDFAYVPDSTDKIFKCQNPACKAEICRLCNERNHIPLRCNEVERPKDVEARKKIEESMTRKLIRVCPKCKKKIVKIDGCNKMSCTCGTLFCYLCRKQIYNYSHFGKKCPLFSRNDDLHVREVEIAGMRARDEILGANPDIRLVHNPTLLTSS